MPHSQANPPATKLRAVIFDAEGVVIDTEGLWDESQRMLLARRGIAYERERIKHLLAGRSLLDGAQILREEYRLPESAAEIAVERRNLARELFSQTVGFVPGFQEFFEGVQAAGVPCCIATSMEPGLFAAVDARLKLNEYFGRRIYFTSDVDGRAKPDPALFLFAAQKLNCVPGECLVIEDSPHGVAAANAAGMRCVALTTTFEAKLLGQADWICESFEQIQQIDALQKMSAD